MSNIEKNENKKAKVNWFFKDVLKSIKDFDKYEDFGLEGVGKTSGYLIKLDGNWQFLWCWHWYFPGMDLNDC